MPSTDIQPPVTDDMAVVEEPPRNTNKARLPASCVLHQSSFDRTKLFVPEAERYDERRCSASITQYADRSSRFHSLAPLNNRTAEGYAHTTLHCWHDTRPFEGPVVPAPKSFDVKERRFVVFGCFCSLSCAKAFMVESGSFDVGAQLVLLERMASELYGTCNVVAAPPRLSLDVFGGPYSIERFRGMSATSEATIQAPPFVSTYMVCEERDLSTAQVSALGVNGISSVRGLRRPAQPVQMRLNEPPAQSPYLDLLKSHGVAPAAPQPAAAASSSSAPKGVRQKNTLARFMET